MTPTLTHPWSDTLIFDTDIWSHRSLPLHCSDLFFILLNFMFLLLLEERAELSFMSDPNVSELSVLLP